MPYEEKRHASRGDMRMLIINAHNEDGEKYKSIIATHYNYMFLTFIINLYYLY